MHLNIFVYIDLTVFLKGNLQVQGTAYLAFTGF